MKILLLFIMFSSYLFSQNKWEKIDLTMLDDHYVWGSIFLNDDPLHGITIKLENDEEGKDTIETISGNFYAIDNIPSGTYTIRPISDEYTFEPPYITLRFYIHKSYDNINFTASLLTSVKNNPNFIIRDNVLYSKEIAGMDYKIISLKGSIVKSGQVKSELNLNDNKSGTYFIQIIKDEDVLFIEKFQVKR